MKLKLSHTQFTALFMIFKSLFADDVTPPKSFEARLMMAILKEIYVQLYKKAVEKKKKYSVSLSEQEALAFWIFFNKYQFFSGEAVYEANLVDTINNNIHQKFS